MRESHDLILLATTPKVTVMSSTEQAGICGNSGIETLHKKRDPGAGPPNQVRGCPSRKETWARVGQSPLIDVRYCTIMPTAKPADLSRQGFLAFGALWTLLLAGFAILIIVIMFWWQAWNSSVYMSSIYPHSIDTQQKVLENTLAAYKMEVDDLQRLISLLIGLASFYTLALGISSYFTAQHIIDRSKESAEDIDEYREQAGKLYEGLEETYPFFTDFGAHINDGIDRLLQLLPDEEERDEFWEKLLEHEKQEILFLERSLAFIEHLKEKRIAELYQRLGKFYSAWYVIEKEDTGIPSASGRSLRMVQDFALRAFFYLERAVQRDQKNFTALNDFGLACIDIWKLPPSKSLGPIEEYKVRADSVWKQSLAIQPNQQRAQYNRANSLKREGKIQDAIEELSEALRKDVWQNKPNPQRVKDMHYNLACCQSLLGKQRETSGEPWKELLDDASTNLVIGCEHYKSTPRVRREALKALQEDCVGDGDLVWLSQKNPNLLKEAEKKLS